MTTFRDEAEKELRKAVKELADSYAQNKTGYDFEPFLDALTVLHEAEVRRVIGKDESTGNMYGVRRIQKTADENKLRAEQRRRAGLGEHENT